MNVLIACEESQIVCTAFRERGHNAFSCDLQECSGGHPEWHIMGDCVPFLNGNCAFTTMDGKSHKQVGNWDLIIAHPPCTDLAVSGAKHFERKRADGSQQKSIDFFMLFTNINCDKVAIENPIGIMSTIYRKPDQIIQPYFFGDPHRKSTCLWLKGLPPLKHTNVVEPQLNTYTCKSGKKVTFDVLYCKGTHGIPRAKLRSKTFPGIALAMADQWGCL